MKTMMSVSVFLSVFLVEDPSTPYLATVFIVLYIVYVRNVYSFLISFSSCDESVV